MLKIIVYKSSSHYSTLFNLISINVIISDLNEMRIINSSSKSRIYFLDGYALFIHVNYFFGSISSIFCQFDLGLFDNIKGFFYRLIVL